MENNDGGNKGEGKRPRGCLWQWLLRGLIVLVLSVGSYFAVAEVLLLFPRNADADPMTGSVNVYFVSNGVHVDVWLPVRAEDLRWDDWLPRRSL